LNGGSIVVNTKQKIGLATLVLVSTICLGFLIYCLCKMNMRRRRRSAAERVAAKMAANPPTRPYGGSASEFQSFPFQEPCSYISWRSDLGSTDHDELGLFAAVPMTSTGFSPSPVPGDKKGKRRMSWSRG
jgi:hypothetical protein